MSKKSQRRERARLKYLMKEGLVGKQTADGQGNAQGSGSAHHPAHQKAKSSGRGKGILAKIKHIYEDEYRKLLWITIILMILAFAQIGYQYASTGDFINRGVSLKGGITIIVPSTTYDALSLEESLKESFGGYDISVVRITSAGIQQGLVVYADITQQEEIGVFTESLAETMSMGKDDYSIEMIGSSLGSSFFREIVFSLLIAFAFMSIVVFLYFRMPVPSAAVILAIFCDIVLTLAVVNLIGMKISTAGIAGFLMLIGYSVDTDILLSTRVLKRKEGTVMDAVYSSLRTGIMMTTTAIIAVSVALIFSESEVLSEIMKIILIGSVADIFFTWIQNVAILRWYLDKHPEKAEIKNAGGA